VVLASEFSIAVAQTRGLEVRGQRTFQSCSCHCDVVCKEIVVYAEGMGWDGVVCTGVEMDWVSGEEVGVV